MGTLDPFWQRIYTVRIYKKELCTCTDSAYYKRHYNEHICKLVIYHTSLPQEYYQITDPNIPIANSIVGIAMGR